MTFPREKVVFFFWLAYKLLENSHCYIYPSSSFIDNICTVNILFCLHYTDLDKIYKYSWFQVLIGMKFFFLMNAEVKEDYKGKRGDEKRKKNRGTQSKPMRDRNKEMDEREDSHGTLRRKDRSRGEEDSKRDCGNEEQNVEILCQNKM